MKLKKTIPALPVEDMKAATAFYAEKLGFTVRHQEDDFAILVRDDVEIHLWRAGDESWRDRGVGMVSLPIFSALQFNTMTIKAPNSKQLEITNVSLISGGISTVKLILGAGATADRYIVSKNGNEFTWSKTQ